jgi:hypothetical protein
MGEFVAIRMIVLRPDVTPADFEEFMTGELLNEMWTIFSEKEADRGLTGIVFLKGNKDARQSYEGAGKADRSESTSAGANADYAWITYWESMEKNKTAWSSSKRSPEWDAYWQYFKSQCYPRHITDSDFISRPEHGPPYDYLGAPGYLFTGASIVHHGRGAGCLVEGFEVVQKWPRETTT